MRAGCHEFQSVNRMIRFNHPQPIALKAGDEANCCVIRLPYSQLGGNAISYGWGGRRQINALPDLRLFCITGAGNFPAERFSVIIPPSSITGAIASYESHRVRLPSKEMRESLKELHG